MTSEGFPLHCSICPKKPNFIDVSHLLTHVASKGHLSHYYKIRVQASIDDDSRQMIDAYDQWYSDCNIEDLMSDRLTAKKRSKRVSLASSLRTTKQKTKPRNTSSALQVDPRLAVLETTPQTPVKPKRQMGTPPHPLASPAFVRSKAGSPKLHLWSTKQPSSFDAVLLDYSPPATPSKHQPKLGPFQRPAPLAQMLYKVGVIKDIDEENDASEATRLKGVLWPGMDIFDAATPMARKKRNQKKETSVVDRLEKNAAGVEANEMIFTPNGHLWKQRAISGKVDFDSSPYKMDHFSSPPKKKYAARIPLGPKDPNRRMTRRTSAALQNQSPIARNATTLMARRDQIAPKRKHDFTVFDDREQEEMNDFGNLGLLTSECHPSASRVPTFTHLGHSLEEPLASMYRPAFQHHPYLTNPFEPMFGLPYYPVHCQLGYDIGWFSYAAQRRNSEEDDGDRDNNIAVAGVLSDGG